MKYEQNIKHFCRFEWSDKSVSREDRIGGYGIAIMMAFLGGVPPTIKAFSDHLGEPRENLQFAFDNLMKSGMFSKNFDARSDKELQGDGVNKSALTVKFKSDDEIIRTLLLNNNADVFGYQIWSKAKAVKSAWCHIAAVASGVIDRNIDKYRV